MIKNRGITFKFVFSVLLSSSIIFFAIFGYNYLVSKKIIIRNIENSAKNLTQSTVNKIEIILRSVEKGPQNFANFLENGSYEKEELLNMLRSLVASNSEIYGSTVAFEPNFFEKESIYFAPYYYKSSGEIKFTYLDSVYNYFDWDWYKLPKDLKALVWSEPYFDKGGGNMIMSTYSVPFYRNIVEKKVFAGIITADVSLSWLQDIVSSIKIGKTGYGFLISKEGKIVTYPKKSFIMKKDIFSLASMRPGDYLKNIASDMIKGNSGFVQTESILTGKKAWLSYAPLPSTGWSLGIIFPQDELMEDITRLNIIVFALALGGFWFLFIVISVISGTITRNLRILAAKTGDIARGDFNFKMPSIKSKDEVGKLADSFIYMRESLKKYIKDLTETTAVKERIESELKIAHDIQMNLLPKKFPHGKNFDIVAFLEPAKAVGGDFYDFFFIDDSHFCFVIGDVSDKGVPAALFMAMAKTLIKLTARELKNPEEILEKVNKEICLENESAMFITIFCGIIDINSGEICYTNAGHNPPILLCKNKSPEFLGSDRSPAIGIRDGSIYRKNKIILKDDDILFMYTDGITEAFSSGGELFSEERLLKEASCYKNQGIEWLSKEILEKIKIFSGNSAQSDDITIMAIQYAKNKENIKIGKKFTIKNDISEIELLKKEISEFGKNNRVRHELISDIQLALEEAVSNIINYAYSDKLRHEICILASLEKNNLIVEIEDDGKPFNPIQFPKSDTDKPIEERPIGGLGVYLFMKLMDKVEYKRENEKNVLIMKKNIG